MHACNIVDVHCIGGAVERPDVDGFEQRGVRQHNMVSICEGIVCHGLVINWHVDVNVAREAQTLAGARTLKPETIDRKSRELILFCFAQAFGLVMFTYF